MTTLSDAIAAYRVCAKAEGQSPRTVSWVLGYVNSFARFLGGEDIALSAIDAQGLRGFIVALQSTKAYQRGHPFTRPQNRPLSPETIAGYVRAVKSFFSFLKREELVASNPVEKVKVPKTPTKAVPTFTQKQVERLLSQPDRHTDMGFRDFTLLLTLVDTAIRVSELSGLKLGDVDLEQGYLRVMGKGQRERFVPVGIKLTKALMKYRLKHRPESASDRFWLTRDGKPLEASRIEKIVSGYGKKAGLNRCYPHRLRHTSAVLYLRNEGDVFTLQKKLGHSSLLMTRHYANLVDADVKAAHLRHSPGDRLKF